VPSKIDLIILILLSIVALIVRYSGIYSTCMVPDEWLYWTKTNMILVNNWKPVVEVFECSPPFLPHICALVATFFYSDLYIFRAVSVVFGALTVPIMYLLGKSLYDRTTGLIAALIMCFTAYHCFYSRIYKLDAFTIFLIVYFLYVFWLCEIRQSKVYTCLAGILLGLAVDAKYLPVFLAGSTMVYMFWVYGFRRDVIKKLLIIYFFAFLVFLPLLVGLFVSGAGMQPFYYYTSSMFQKGGVAQRPIQYYTIGSLIETSMVKICEILAYGADLMGIVVGSMFKIVTLTVLLTSVLVFGFHTLRKEKRASLLFISLFVLGIFLLIMRISKYYLLYILPFYAPMAACVFKVCTDFITKTERSYGRIFAHVFTAVFIVYLTLVIISGALSPYWDRGDYSWVCYAVNYIAHHSADIKNRSIKIGTFIFVNEPVEYHAFLKDISVEVYNLGIVKRYPEQTKQSIIQQINTINPDYILMFMESISFYGIYFKGKLKERILENYYIACITNTYPYKGLLLKRKVIAPHEINRPTHRGYIQLFESSVPSVLKCLKIYVVNVKIKNLENKTTKFTVRLYSNKYLIYIYHRFQNVTLDKGESTIISYRILPLKRCFGEVPLNVEVYTSSGNNIMESLVDSDIVYIKYIY